MHLLSSAIIAICAITASTSPIEQQLIAKRIFSPLYEFSTVTGYFLQDDTITDDKSFDPVILSTHLHH